MHTNPSPDQLSRYHRNPMQTFTGRQLYPMDPHPRDIDAVDIAHALSMQCRFNGHVHTFYSVAEHCVLVSRAVSPANALWGLLHDASEAYVGDMIRPLKLHMSAYRKAEGRVMLAITRKFGISDAMPDEVHAADARIVLDERAALMSPPLESSPMADWGLGDLAALGIDIPAWPPSEAKRQYLSRLEELTTTKG